jgi:acyl-CoA thioesterase II
VTVDRRRGADSDLGTDYATSDADFGQTVVDALLALFDLEKIEENIFRGLSPDVARQRVFGGQVAGQALVAAGRTVEPERLVHSLHSYFIRPGDPSVPIIYTVDRVRDGRSFTTRRVVAIQHGKAIFALSASFQLPQPGIDHQNTMPPTPLPDELPAGHDQSWARVGEEPTSLRIHWPFDMRFVDRPSWEQAPTGGADENQLYRVWMKARGRMPDDPLLQACAVTFACDLTLLDSILVRHRLSEQGDDLRMASLDHAVWFHRPFRVDEWLLYAQESPTASGSRGLTTARVYDERGVHVASVVQEGMIRLPSA